MIKAFLFLLIIIFFPFPLIFKLIIYDNKAATYFYWFKIHKKRHIAQRLKHKIPDYIKSIDLEFFAALLNKQRRSKFKPLSYTSIDLGYGFDDVYYTGIFYGIILNINPFIYNVLSNYTFIKKYYFNLTPNFEKPELKIEVKAIIVLNIFIILNILFNIHSTRSKIYKIRKEGI